MDPKFDNYFEIQSNRHKHYDYRVCAKPTSTERLNVCPAMDEPYET